ncbi:MAG: ABC transporter permease [Papillibacter sp.]|jgi:peptide/nickel transport system permease protein|nr:ABC transporter permease [Papillibacter sp.]
MGRYIIRRFLFLIPTIFFITMLIFLLVRFVPGDVVDLMVAEMGNSSGPSVNREITSEIVKQQLGLDVPIHIQYIRWMGNIFRGNLGKSLWTDRAVIDDLAKQIPISLELGIIAILIDLIISLPIAVYSAIRQETLGDYIVRTFAILAISIPSVWVATMSVVYPSIWWKWTPAIEYIPMSKDFGRNIIQFLLPASIIGLSMAGGTMRMTRTMMLEVMRQDYIRTAWSKGLNERAVVFRHALKNAFLPILTSIGNRLPILIGGSVAMEQIFGLPGMGRYLIQALNQRDYPIISAVTLVMAAFILVVNIIIDILCAYLDPRVKFD